MKGNGQSEDRTISLEEDGPPLTVEEFAAAARIARNTAYSLVASGAVKSVRLGRAIRIPRAAARLALNGEKA
jgi:excisionase family DNA binding protein